MSKPIKQVAIGLLFHHTKVLAGWREAHLHQGNQYEFPGGKVEAGESPVDACQREIFEEVGVHLTKWFVFDQIRHEYDDVIVYLHIFYSYVPPTVLAKIKMPWQWYSREQLMQLSFPKGNTSILNRLDWPRFIKIDSQIESFQSNTDLLFYLRKPTHGFNLEQLNCHSVSVLHRLILNIYDIQRLPENMARHIRIVHLKQQQLLNLTANDLKGYVGKSFIAACHDLSALQHAEDIGCQAVLLSPVLTTATHPEAKELGWVKFGQWVKHTQLMVYALGGMKVTDLATAQQHGAYGIAGIRHF